MSPPSAIPSQTPPPFPFKKEKHVRYWLRCLKTHLPTAYTPNDAQRMTFAFFTLSALDLLGALHTHTTASERAAYADWIYRCQHPGGGFRGFTGTDAGAGADVEGGGKWWDPANLAATFFALAALTVLGEGMGRVRRRECLEWVRGLQGGDGSFGEALGVGGIVEGGADVRFCYLAAGVRWMLRRGGEMDGVGDVDVVGLVRYVARSVTYDGGIAKAPFHEAHAGWTYCGVGTLKLLGRLPSTREDDSTPPTNALSEHFTEDLIRWLVSRQTLYIQEVEEYTVADDDSPVSTPMVFPPSFHVQGAYAVSLEEVANAAACIELTAEELQWAGFNGRCNKIADTCYAFWVGAALGMLQSLHLQDFNAIQRYLLDKTQHMIGGFGKLPGDPPDILHSYLGLAALATMREPELKSIDPTLCMSISAIEQFEQRAAAE